MAKRFNAPDQSGVDVPTKPLPQVRSSPTIELIQPHLWRPGELPPPLPNGSAPPLLLLINSSLTLVPSQALLHLLMPKERERHLAFRQPADRLRYALGRASVRQLLGHWLNLSPTLIPLEAGPHGKPFCPLPKAPEFNVSHSGELILLAFHSTHPLGVDVERARPNLAWEPIARKVLEPAEWATLQAEPVASRGQAFLVAWCRLEARLKAHGRGLAGLQQERERRIDNLPDDPSLQERLWDVAMPKGYTAALFLQMTKTGSKVKANPA